MINDILNLDTKLLKDFISEEEIKNQDAYFTFYHKQLVEKTGTGSEYTGWVELPSDEVGNALLLKKIDILKDKLSALKFEAIVLIGIGGSYMGTKAVYEALAGSDFQGKHKSIFYAGHQLEPEYYRQLTTYLEKIDFLTVVISKSGTTTEPAIAFRLIRDLIQKRYKPEEAKQRIIAITDEKTGALRKLADSEGYETFIVPGNVGGRFSVLTPVGLVPLAIAGFDVKLMLEGAKTMQQYCCANDSTENNVALRYAAVRHLLMQRGKPIEVLSSFYPSYAYIAEWWKQLFGESEGKEMRGIFPASMMFTTDLHSLGQYVQDGMRIFFETILSIDEVNDDLKIPKSDNSDDGLTFLENVSLSEVNKKAEQATALAHFQGKVPVMQLRLKKNDLFHLGALLYFFEFSCGISAYAFEVNPFDQPGVEAYKNNMYALLGKPGYESLRESITNNQL